MYLLALGAAFEMSLGPTATPTATVPARSPLQGLRALARLGIFVVFFLAVLAACGHAAVEAAMPPARKRAARGRDMRRAAARVLGRAAALVPYPNAPPPLYAWLAQQPRGVVAEFPMPMPDSAAGRRAALCLPVDVPLDAARERLQRLLPAVLPHADRQAARRSPTRARRTCCARDGVRYVIVQRPPIRRTAPAKCSSRCRRIRHSYSSAIATTDAAMPSSSGSGSADVRSAAAAGVKAGTKERVAIVVREFIGICVAILRSRGGHFEHTRPTEFSRV